MALDDSRPAVEQTNGTGEPAGGGFDFEDGYNKLHPEYTRKTQELATIRETLTEYEQIFDALNDPETREQALRLLGGEQGGGPQAAPQKAPDEEFVDPLEQRLDEFEKRFGSVEQRIAREDEEAEQAKRDKARNEFIGSAIGIIEKSLSQDGRPFKFTDKEDTTLGNLAIAMAGSDEVPDVEGAYNVLYGEDGLRETWRTQWIDTKRNAPFAPLGSNPSAVKKPTNARERIAYMNQLAAAQSQNE